MLKAVHFGAGNIGRGFIGYLLSKSGYEITFVDIFDFLVQDINTYKEYTVITLSNDKNKEKVSNVNAINLNDKENLCKHILDTDLITTSIGANNLASTGKLLKELLMVRMENNKKPLDIIACENALFATNTIKEAILEDASSEFRAYVEETIGFPNSAVDRIVPNTKMKKDCPVDVAVEDFYEWDIEKGPIKVNKDIIGAEYTENLAPYLERKLFLLNGAHATIAYLGYLKNYKFVHEAINDPFIREVVLGFHSEGVQALNIKHNMDIDVLKEYSRKIIKRFENMYLQDVVSRVGRDPIRKLSFNDRLISPLKLCIEYNIDCPSIITGIAAGFLFNDMEDPKAEYVQNSIKEKGLKDTIIEVCGLSEDSVVIEAIVDKYNELNS